MDCGASDSFETNSSNSNGETPSLHFFSSSILVAVDSSEKYLKGDSWSSKLCTSGTMNLPFHSSGVIDTPLLDTAD